MHVAAVQPGIFGGAPLIPQRETIFCMRLLSTIYNFVIRLFKTIFCCSPFEDPNIPLAEPRRDEIVPPPVVVSLDTVAVRRGTPVPRWNSDVMLYVASFLDREALGNLWLTCVWMRDCVDRNALNGDTYATGEEGTSNQLFLRSEALWGPHGLLPHGARTGFRMQEGFDVLCQRMYPVWGEREIDAAGRGSVQLRLSKMLFCGGRLSSSPEWLGLCARNMPGALVGFNAMHILELQSLEEITLETMPYPIARGVINNTRVLALRILVNGEKKVFVFGMRGQRLGEGVEMNLSRNAERRLFLSLIRGEPITHETLGEVSIDLNREPCAAEERLEGSSNERRE